MPCLAFLPYLRLFCRSLPLSLLTPATALLPPRIYPFHLVVLRSRIACCASSFVLPPASSFFFFVVFFAKATCKSLTCSSSLSLISISWFCPGYQMHIFCFILAPFLLIFLLCPLFFAIGCCTWIRFTRSIFSLFRLVYFLLEAACNFLFNPSYLAFVTSSYIPVFCPLFMSSSRCSRADNLLASFSPLPLIPSILITLSFAASSHVSLPR